jgi:aminomethyltransferase
MGYVEVADATVGTAIEIEIRGKKFPAVIQKKPILKKGP